MAGWAIGGGNLAEDVGKAYTDQRAFNLKQQQAQADIELQHAQAQEALQRGKQLEQYGQRDKWQPITNQPTLNPKTGQWEILMRNVFDGSTQTLPVGAPANSLQATLQQAAAGQGGTLVNDRTLQLAIAKKLGVSNPFVGMQHVTRQIGDREYVGYIDPATQQWSPIQDSGGQPISKGISQSWQQVLDENNRPTLVPVPNRVSVPGMPPAGGNAQGPNASLPNFTSAPPRSMTPASALKDVSPDMRQEIHYLNKIDTLVQGIEPLLAPDKDNNSVIDRMQSAFSHGKYSAGFAGAQSKLNQLESLMNVLGGSAFMKGRPAMAFIEQIQQHLPKPWMTPAAQYQRLQDLKPILAEWQMLSQQDAGMKTIGQQFIGGPQPAKTASTSDIQSYATRKGISVGAAIQEFRNAGYQVNAAGR